MRAQGSLEYLVIITAAIAVLAVVASFVVGYFSTQSDQFYYASCSNAASLCANTLITDSENQCNVCNNACNFSDGTEIFPGAVECCKCAKKNDIYNGAAPNACLGCTPTPPCSDGATRTCDYTAELCRGVKTCAGGIWGSCQDADLTDNCPTVPCTANEACTTPTYNCPGTKFCSGGVLGPCIDNPDDCPSASFNEKAVYTDSNVWTVTEGVAVGDANNDGTTEIILLNRLLHRPGYPAPDYVDYNLTIHTCNSLTCSAASFIDKIIGTTPRYLPPMPGLFVGEGDNEVGNEIILGGNATPSGELTKYNWTGSSWTRTLFGTSYPDYDTPGNSFTASFAVGDADNDGLVDIVTSQDMHYGKLTRRTYNPITHIWLEQNLTAQYIYSPLGPLAIGNANGVTGNEVIDGADYTGGSVTLYTKVGASWVESTTGISTGSTPLSVVIGDVNNDGADELVIGQGPSATYQLIVYKNVSNVWQQYAAVSGLNTVNSLAIGDVIRTEAGNELVVGSTGGLYIYRYADNQLTQFKKLNYLNTLSVAIGNADNFPGNEIVAGGEGGVKFYSQT